MDSSHVTGSRSSSSLSLSLLFLHIIREAASEPSRSSSCCCCGDGDQGWKRKETKQQGGEPRASQTRVLAATEAHPVFEEGSGHILSQQEWAAGATPLHRAPSPPKPPAPPPRSYKNGYVWNDLAESDIIFPADGVEYVLKGSEIIPGAYGLFLASSFPESLSLFYWMFPLDCKRFFGCIQLEICVSARFQHITASTRQPKPLPAPHGLHLEPEDDDEEEAAEEEVTEEEEELRGGKGMGGDMHPNGAGYSRLSRGVSTDEIERVAVPANHHGLPQLPTDDSSPPSSTTSDKPPGRGASRRFEEVDQTPEPGLTRNSVLLQLIACGAAALKGRSSPSGGMIKAAATSASPVEERRSNGRHRGVVSRLASRAGEEDELRRDWDNPRFCHPLIEDKEYFSGSIVEGSRGPSEPSLKKSSSYNEER
ncbi:hypothetical protein BHM03_00019939 [Ensete ventricosum]|nr:hypothetical protein BHM03_00019939 [Ensete ventricosum]